VLWLCACESRRHTASAYHSESPPFGWAFVVSAAATRRSRAWPRGVAAVLALGFLIVAVLWVCFGPDCETTRRIDFAVATLHVPAEEPFLLRMV
jgi:hypothetical protein